MPSEISRDLRPRRSQQDSYRRNSLEELLRPLNDGINTLELMSIAHTPVIAPQDSGDEGDAELEEAIQLSLKDALTSLQNILDEHDLQNPGERGLVDLTDGDPSSEDTCLCIICQEPVTNWTYVTLQCGNLSGSVRHMLHKSCLRTLIHYRVHCPLCESVMKVDSISQPVSLHLTTIYCCML